MPTFRHQYLCRLVLYQFPQGLFLSRDISLEPEVLMFAVGSNQFRRLLFVGATPDTLDRCTRRHTRIFAVKAWGCRCVPVASFYVLGQLTK